MQLGPAGLDLIKRFEGCERLRPDGRLEAYPDPGTGKAPWTIGWGTTGLDVGPGTIWTHYQCDTRFAAHLLSFVREVNAALRLPGGALAATTQNQFDALVSFHYNTGAIAKAALTRLHKAGNHRAVAGTDRDITPGEFGKWVKADGRRLTGLIRRRAAEAMLYRS